MSLAGLNGIAAISSALMLNGPGGATKSWWPSAGALSTRSTPMLPLAPGRLSTMKGCPCSRASSSAARRASRSTAPPGGLVAMTRTGRSGQPCARAIARMSNAKANVMRAETCTARFFPSVDLGADRSYDLGVARVLRAQQRSEFFGRADVRLEAADAADALADGRLGEQPVRRL